jgi:hypothetical protein
MGLCSFGCCSGMSSLLGWKKNIKLYCSSINSGSGSGSDTV